jgi:hypothetical protein
VSSFEENRFTSSNLKLLKYNFISSLEKLKTTEPLVYRNKIYLLTMSLLSFLLEETSSASELDENCIKNNKKHETVLVGHQTQSSASY